MLPSPSLGPPLLSGSWSPPLPCGMGLAGEAGAVVAGAGAVVAGRAVGVVTGACAKLTGGAGPRRPAWRGMVCCHGGVAARGQDREQPGAGGRSDESERHDWSFGSDGLEAAAAVLAPVTRLPA